MTPGNTRYLGWRLPIATCPGCGDLACAPCSPVEFVPLQLGGR